MGFSQELRALAAPIWEASLNHPFVRGITPPGRMVTVRVPRGRGTQVAARYDSLPVNERITFVDHYVSAGQTLTDIAHRYHVTVGMLQGANPSLKPHALRVGQTQEADAIGREQLEQKILIVRLLRSQEHRPGRCFDGPGAARRPR